ncbi:MAG: glycosyl hydrolase 53 family protein, partial [Bacteroidota bacterium]
MRKPAFAFLWGFLTLGIFGHSCQSPEPSVEPPSPIESTPSAFYRGADLSYVNEMLDCGGIYRNPVGKEIDPYEVFAEAGTNLVRVRLWHTPTWTAYSDLPDVTRTIQQATSRGMEVLLDFHYSDDWADPGN